MDTDVGVRRQKPVIVFQSENEIDGITGKRMPVGLAQRAASRGHLVLSCSARSSVLPVLHRGVRQARPHGMAWHGMAWHGMAWREPSESVETNVFDDDSVKDRRGTSSQEFGLEFASTMQSHRKTKTGPKRERSTERGQLPPHCTATATEHCH